MNTSYGNTVELVMDQDVVQEFNAQTHDNTAEFGYYTGGVINMSTKSGSNAFHGEAYEYLRNTVLRRQQFLCQPRRHRENRPGTRTSLAPISADRSSIISIFFFGDYQGYRQTHGYPTNVTVPTAAELTGDFSATLHDPHLRSTYYLRLQRQCAMPARGSRPAHAAAVLV